MEYLGDNARMTYVDIGKAVGVSDAPVYNRVKRLREIGVLKRFTIEVDESALGRKVLGFILVNVKSGAVGEVSKHVSEIERVKEVHEIHGREDLILKVMGKNLTRLRSAIFKIRRIPDVAQTEFIPVFRTWKD
jgi:Lrp/AsnC family transcriptional regulator for asnA, asnC and gidA